MFTDGDNEDTVIDTLLKIIDDMESILGGDDMTLPNGQALKWLWFLYMSDEKAAARAIGSLGAKAIYNNPYCIIKQRLNELPHGKGTST